MKIIETQLKEVLLIEPRIFGDDRGYFLETWNETRYKESGILGPFVQDNISFSQKGVLRGLHFQNTFPQGKLVYVLEGEIFDVAVDIRKKSPNFGKWVSEILSGKNKKQIYIPPGFAHGFVVLSTSALFAYKCTERYRPESENTIIWNDPHIGIDWPIQNPVLSPKDAEGRNLRDLVS